MMVRVQKSKEDGLDFSLALSLFIFCSFDGKDIQSEAHQEISGPLSPFSEWLVGLSSFVRCARKKKKKKVVFAYKMLWGRRRLHAISPFQLHKKEKINARVIQRTTQYKNGIRCRRHFYAQN